ncbi:MAG: hypothetical protein ACRED2_07985 [Methylocella sp.]
MFTSERLAAQAMLKARRKAVGHRITAGTTRPMTRRIMPPLRAIKAAPHVAQNKSPQPP